MQSALLASPSSSFPADTVLLPAPAILFPVPITAATYLATVLQIGSKHWLSMQQHTRRCR